MHHTISLIVSENWPFKYSRKKAVYPMPWVESHKFWPSVRRINDAFGDRNLVCSCPPISDFKGKYFYSLFLVISSTNPIFAIE